MATRMTGRQDSESRGGSGGAVGPRRRRAAAPAHAAGEPYDPTPHRKALADFLRLWERCTARSCRRAKTCLHRAEPPCWRVQRDRVEPVLPALRAAILRRRAEIAGEEG